MNILNSRKFRQGTLATVITVLVVAAIVVFNLLVTVVSERYGLSLDLTSNQLYSLSDETKDYLRTLDKDVIFTVLASEEDFRNYSNSYTYMDGAEVLKLFSQASSRISLRFVDTTKDPTFANAYPSDLDLQPYQVLVESGGNYTTFQVSDFLNVGSYSASSKAEQTVASAILNVVSDETVRVVVLSGHSEQDVSLLTGRLGQNNYEVVNQNLLVDEEIDTEATIAILAAPARDLEYDELQKLDRFLENGGKYGKTLFYLPSIYQEELPQMEAFLADWGIGIVRGVVMETENGRWLDNNFLPMTQYVESDYSAILQSRDLLVIIPYARPLELLFEAKGGVQTTSLLEFYETAGVYLEGSEQTDIYYLSDNQSALAMGQVTRYDGTTPMVSTVLVSSSIDMVNNERVMAGNLGNNGYIINLLNSLSDRENVLIVENKPMDTTSIVISGGQLYTLLWVFVVILPLAVLAAGIVVWLRRRHK